MKTCRTVATATVIAALLALAAPAAEAKTKRFRPQDFQAESTAAEYTRSPLAVGALLGGTGALFTAELGLPKGATVTRLSLYSNGVAATRSAVLVKYRSGIPSPIMAAVSESAAHLDLVTPMFSWAVANSAPDNLVQPGYLYLVQLSCAPGTAIWALDVDYTP